MVLIGRRPTADYAHSMVSKDSNPQVRGPTWGFPLSRLRDSNPRPTHYAFARSPSVNGQRPGRHTARDSGGRQRRGWPETTEAAPGLAPASLRAH